MMTDSTLRLAIDVGPLYGHRTGVGVATAGLVDQLATDARIALDPFVVSFRSTPDVGHRKLPLPGIVASHLWARSNRPSADRWLSAADVVHGTNYVAPPTTRPTVISVYDCWFLEHEHLASPLARRVGRRLRRSAAAGAWIHAGSEATAVRARDLLGTDRVRTVLLGAPPSIEAPATAPPGHDLAGRTFILAIGTEEHRKNLPLLLDAFERMGGSGAAHLVLAGARGDTSAAIDERLLALPAPLTARVHRLGPVDQGTKRWLLDNADVLAYPSLDEGFGFPILEAQAAGVPVVASDVGSVGEVGGAGVALVDPSDADALAERLSIVIESRIDRLTMITAGNSNLRRFSWERTAGDLTELYHHALEHA